LGAGAGGFHGMLGVAYLPAATETNPQTPKIPQTRPTEERK